VHTIVNFFFKCHSRNREREREKGGRETESGARGGRKWRATRGSERERQRDAVRRSEQVSGWAPNLRTKIESRGDELTFGT